MADLFERITDDYMPMLLNWSYKKTGERDRAEDLTQEVLLQIFSAIRKSTAEITDVEHFVWKIAHYTWCNYLRSRERGKNCVSMENLQLEDGRDFAAEYAEQEYRQELTARMRKRVSRLSRLQREIMISFYLEGKSVRDIAQNHQMTESAVKWHLRLLWLLIYQFALRLRIPYPDFERPVRMDGGKYLPLGLEPSDDRTAPKVLDTGGWSYNGCMQNDNFTWFGMYNFGRSEIEDMIDACDPQMQKLHGLLCEILHSDYNISGYDERKRFILAQLVHLFSLACAPAA